MPSAFLYARSLFGKQLLMESDFNTNEMTSDPIPDTDNLKQPENRSHHKAVFPAQYSSLERLREFVAQEAESIGMEANDIYAVKLAVDEAFTNIVEHAFGGECHEDIECRCQISAESLIITLVDYGESFDPSSVPEPDLESSLEERKIGGLGLYFMHKLMDEVHYEFIPDNEGKAGCNILTMAKRRVQEV